MEIAWLSDCDRCRPIVASKKKKKKKTKKKDKKIKKGSEVKPFFIKKHPLHTA